MRLTISGELNRYYLQTLCMLFFPGAKFSEEETDGNEAVFALKFKDGGAEVNCKFISDGKEASASHTAYPNASLRISSGEETDPVERAAKIAAGAAALKAGKKLFGMVPAWGILTGIRPAKVASELLFALDGEGNRLRTPADTRAILSSDFFVTPRKAALAVDIAKSEQKIVRLAKSGKSPTCSVYISIPFCPSRCSYCSFVSYSTKRLMNLIPEYLERLLSDIRRTFGYIKDRGFRVTSIYIGGGTPTTLTEEELELLLATVNESVDVSRLAEFSLEAGRPDTITAEKMRIAVKYGVTRVSINPQTTDDRILKAIGRRHTVDDFYRAFDIARTAGVGIINTDLIAGLPGDDFAGFSKSVDRMIALDPENITVHTFCVKKAAEILKIDTEIYSRSAEETVKAVDYSQLRLKNAGYLPYYIYRQKNTVGNLENVGFSKRGAEGIYNVLMMEEIHSIFAVGAGAVTKLVKTDDRDVKSIERIYEPKYPYEYLKGDYEKLMDEKFGKCDSFFEFH